MNLVINRGLRSAKALGSQLSANNAHALRETAINELGIAKLPTFIVKDALNDGRLKRVLSNATWSSAPNHIIWLYRQFTLSKVEANIEFLKGEFSDPS